MIGDSYLPVLRQCHLAKSKEEKKTLNSQIVLFNCPFKLLWEFVNVFALFNFQKISVNRFRAPRTAVETVIAWFKRI